MASKFLLKASNRLSQTVRREQWPVIKFRIWKREEVRQRPFLVHWRFVGIVFRVNRIFSKRISKELRENCHLRKKIQLKTNWIHFNELEVAALLTAILITGWDSLTETATLLTSSCWKQVNLFWKLQTSGGCLSKRIWRLTFNWFYHHWTSSKRLQMTAQKTGRSHKLWISMLTACWQGGDFTSLWFCKWFRSTAILSELRLSDFTM